MIGVVDYGLGNIRAFLNIYEHLGIPAKAARSQGEIQAATHLVLPGVGSFDWAMEKLDSSGLRGILDEVVLGEGRPVLGVCVGLQIMCRQSDEGANGGLGWLAADVRRLPAGGDERAMPHMGWNDVVPTRSHPLFASVRRHVYYFLHSFAVVADDPTGILGRTSYGDEFVSAMAVGNIMGTQFHPEKSHESGMRILRNLWEL